MMNTNKLVSMLIFLTLLLAGQTAHATLTINETPLFLTLKADPNVLLNMSVETPMGGAAYSDQAGNPTGCPGRTYSTLGGGGSQEYGTCYMPATEYLGYFDPNRCYTYGSNRFNPSANKAVSHTCSLQWSGNFLNWATMTAIDEFIWTMTGGNRFKDTTSLTVIRRARKQNNNSWFPHKAIGTGIGPGSVSPDTVTPFSKANIFIENTDFGFKAGTSRGASDLGTFNVDVRVCQQSDRLESNCKSYGTYYKPEGLVQKNADKMRFAVTSYSFDNDKDRDGGVLRSNMKYVGPTYTDPSGTVVNAKKEFGSDGLLIDNPDDATGGDNSGVINYINKFSAPGYKSYDPIGELYYESIRYFKHEGPTPEYSSGLTAAEHGGFQVLNGTNWTDPIQYSCQKNFIIGINDANPWLDKRLPGTYFTCGKAGNPGLPGSFTANDCNPPSNADGDIDVTALTNKVGALEGLNGATWTNTGTWTVGVLPNTTSGTNDSVGYVPGAAGAGSCTNKTITNLGEVMGTCPVPDKQNSYYIAGLAYYANTTDLRPDIPDIPEIQNIESYFIDTQEYSSNPLDGNKNMLWLAGKYGGFVDSNGNGKPDLSSEWDKDEDGVPDNYVFASQPKKLVDALTNAFNNIVNKTSSSAALAANSTSKTVDTTLYQAKFDTGKWTGHLYALLVDDSGVPINTYWDAADKMPSPADRNILTYNGSSGQLFTTCSSPNLNVAEKLALDTDSNGTVDFACTDRLNWIRGQSVVKMRDRTSILGDIINSDPAYDDKNKNFGYKNLPTIEPEQAGYEGFVAGKTHKPMVYVGANDGMLHGFRADTGDLLNSGKELLAYIPMGVYNNLSQLTSTSYQHKYYVDGAPLVEDAYVGGNWKTVLVSGLGGGGKSVFALDVTNPETFTETNVMWEYPKLATPVADIANLGLTYSQPQIARLHNGQWAAIFGNGYNSSTGTASLYIVDLQTGNLIKQIDTLSGPDNGLSTPKLYDYDNDKIVDYVYAGDLQGHMWKFDLNDTSVANWKVAFAVQPLFTARNLAGEVQPITSQPQVAAHLSGTLVYFGTGQYLQYVDVNNKQEQSFYAIWDNGTAVATTDRSQLQQQSIDLEMAKTYVVDDKGTPDTSDDVTATYSLRGTTSNTVDYATKRGWYMDLVPPSGPAGERVISTPLLKYGRVIFVTLIPDAGDPCKPGGDSWLMELDAISGAAPTSSVFDFNNDGQFDSYDNLAGGGASGVKSTVGITKTPIWLDKDAGTGFKEMSGSSGEIMSLKNKGGGPPPGPGPGGGTFKRIYWMQIQ
jgi:type IV pilus assembly protein PilY1